MKKKFNVFMLATGIGVCFFLLLGEMGAIRSEEKVKKSVEPPIAISGADSFKKLERPLVQFYHDRHTVALEKEGCGVCHPQDEEDEESFVFEYPKKRDEKNKKTLMDSYHESCIGCHNQRAKKGKKTGVTTCGECHIRKNSPNITTPPAD